MEEKITKSTTKAYYHFDYEQKVLLNMEKKKEAQNIGEGVKQRVENKMEDNLNSIIGGGGEKGR